MNTVYNLVKPIFHLRRRPLEVIRRGLTLQSLLSLQIVQNVAKWEMFPTDICLFWPLRTTSQPSARGTRPLVVYTVCVHCMYITISFPLYVYLHLDGDVFPYSADFCLMKIISMTGELVKFTLLLYHSVCYLIHIFDVTIQMEIRVKY